MFSLHLIALWQYLTVLSGFNLINCFFITGSLSNLLFLSKWRRKCLIYLTLSFSFFSCFTQYIFSLLALYIHNFSCFHGCLLEGIFFFVLTLSSLHSPFLRMCLQNLLVFLFFFYKILLKFQWLWSHNTLNIIAWLNEHIVSSYIAL